jgi:cytochrome P450 family 26 subfamily A
MALWLVSQWPWIVHLLVTAAGLLASAAWWRARPGYGRRRRWPPGSLGIGQSLDAIDQRRFYSEQAKRFGPLFKMSQFGRPVVCVFGLDRGRQLLADHGRSLAAATLPHNRLIPRGFLRYMHAETHKAIAPLFRATFSSVALDQLAPGVRECYQRALARLAADSTARPEGANARPYLERAVFECLAWLLYGLVPDDPRADRLARLMSTLQPGHPGGRGWRRRTRAALAGIAAIMQEIRDGWDAGSAVPPAALRSLVESEPEAIVNPTYSWNFAMISRLAWGDLTGLNDWLFKMCCDHAWALDAVRRGPDAHWAAQPDGQASSLDPAVCIVMETLRLEQSEYLYRKVARPVEFEGFVLPRGWLIRLLIQESHRDPAVFSDPERFDPSALPGAAHPSRVPSALMHTAAWACGWRTCWVRPWWMNWPATTAGSSATARWSAATGIATTGSQAPTSA